MRKAIVVLSLSAAAIVAGVGCTKPAAPKPKPVATTTTTTTRLAMPTKPANFSNVVDCEGPAGIRESWSYNRYNLLHSGNDWLAVQASLDAPYIRARAAVLNCELFS